MQPIPDNMGWEECIETLENNQKEIDKRLDRIEKTLLLGKYARIREI